MTEEQLNKLNKYIRVAIMFKQVGAKIMTAVSLSQTVNWG